MKRGRLSVSTALLEELFGATNYRVVGARAQTHSAGSGLDEAFVELIVESPDLPDTVEGEYPEVRALCTKQLTSSRVEIP